MSRTECPVCDFRVCEYDDDPPDGHTLTCTECDTLLRYDTDADCDGGVWINQSQWVKITPHPTPHA